MAKLRINLSNKMTLAVVVVALFSLSLTVSLNYYKFENTYSNMTKSRLIVLGLDLKHTIESGVNLGVPLSELKNTQRAIEQAKLQDPQISAIDVFDEEGKFKFRTVGTDSEVSIPNIWLQKHRDSALRDQINIWNLEDDEAFIFGVPLLTDFGQDIGGLAISYARAYNDTVLSQVTLDLIKYVLIAVLGFALIAAIFISLFFRNLSTSFKRMHYALNDIDDNGEKDVNKSELEAHFEHFYSNAEQASKVLKDLESQLN